MGLNRINQKKKSGVFNEEILYTYFESTKYVEKYIKSKISEYMRNWRGSVNNKFLSKNENVLIIRYVNKLSHKILIKEILSSAITEK